MDKKELQQFLSMANYMREYVPNLVKRLARKFYGNGPLKTQNVSEKQKISQ